MLTAAALRPLDEGTSVILDVAFQQRKQRDVLMDGIEGCPFAPAASG